MNWFGGSEANRRIGMCPLILAVLNRDSSTPKLSQALNPKLPYTLKAFLNSPGPQAANLPKPLAFNPEADPKPPAKLQSVEVLA